jgi:hypothetical protein
MGNSMYEEQEIKHNYNENLSNLKGILEDNDILIDLFSNISNNILLPKYNLEHNMELNNILNLTNLEIDNYLDEGKLKFIPKYFFLSEKNISFQNEDNNIKKYEEIYNNYLYNENAKSNIYSKKRRNTSNLLSETSFSNNAFTINLDNISSMEPTGKVSRNQSSHDLNIYSMSTTINGKINSQLNSTIKKNKILQIGKKEGFTISASNSNSPNRINSERKGRINIPKQYKKKSISPKNKFSIHKNNNNQSINIKNNNINNSIKKNPNLNKNKSFGRNEIRKIFHNSKEFKNKSLDRFQTILSKDYSNIPSIDPTFTKKSISHPKYNLNNKGNNQDLINYFGMPHSFNTEFLTKPDKKKRNKKEEGSYVKAFMKLRGLDVNNCNNEVNLTTIQFDNTKKKNKKMQLSFNNSLNSQNSSEIKDNGVNVSVEKHNNIQKEYCEKGVQYENILFENKTLKPFYNNNKTIIGNKNNFQFNNLNNEGNVTDDDNNIDDIQLKPKIMEIPNESMIKKKDKNFLSITVPIKKLDIENSIDNKDFNNKTYKGINNLYNGSFQELSKPENDNKINKEKKNNGEEKDNISSKFSFNMFSSVNSNSTSNFNNKIGNIQTTDIPSENSLKFVDNINDYLKYKNNFIQNRRKLSSMSDFSKFSNNTYGSMRNIINYYNNNEIQEGNNMNKINEIVQNNSIFQRKKNNNSFVNDINNNNTNNFHNFMNQQKDENEIEQKLSDNINSNILIESNRFPFNKIESNNINHPNNNILDSKDKIEIETKKITNNNDQNRNSNENKNIYSNIKKLKKLKEIQILTLSSHESSKKSNSLNLIPENLLDLSKGQMFIKTGLENNLSKNSKDNNNQILNYNNNKSKKQSSKLSDIVSDYFIEIDPSNIENINNNYRIKMPSTGSVSNISLNKKNSSSFNHNQRFSSNIPFKDSYNCDDDNNNKLDFLYIKNRSSQIN